MFRMFVCFFSLNLKDPAFSTLLLLFQCILVVFAIVAVSNAIPIELGPLGHYGAPIYAPVAKAIHEPIVSVCSINLPRVRDFHYTNRVIR